MYGGADLSTIDPNPTVTGYGDSAAADNFTQIANTAGQWGATIASIVSGNPVAAVSTPTGVRTIGAAGSYTTGPTMGNSGLLILVLIGVVVVILVMKE